MTEQLHRRILKLAAPIILANLSIPLLGVVDTAILGHLDDATHLGAVAIGAQIITVVLWVFGFLRMGTTSVASRQHGAGDTQGLLLLIQRSLIIALALGCLLNLLFPVIIGPATALMTDHQLIAGHAETYASIRILGAPATLCVYAIIGWLIGQQNTRLPAILLVITNGVNIVLDFYFIIFLGLESLGAAIASVCAEYLGLLVAVLAVTRKLGMRRLLVPSSPILKRAPLIQLATMNSQIMVRTFALVMTTTFFIAMSARFGEITLAANAIILNLLLLTAYGLDGIANATEAMCGSAKGKQDRSELDAVIRSSNQVAFALAVGCSLLILLGQHVIVAIYTDLPDVRTTTLEYLPWMIVLPLIGVWSFQYDGIFIGLGLTREMMQSMLFSVVCIFAPIWWLTRGFENHGLWFAMLCWFAARGLSQRYLLRRRYPFTAP